jgi:phage tail sheath protein FI
MNEEVNIEQLMPLVKNHELKPIFSAKQQPFLCQQDIPVMEQSELNAYDRINVRRLIIQLEKFIAEAAKENLFEFNDAFTRKCFTSMVEPYLYDIEKRGGIYDFCVVCDETNNPPQVVESNKFVGDIYIKPTKAINFIQLNFVAVTTGVSFDEVVGEF